MAIRIEVKEPQDLTRLLNDDGGFTAAKLTHKELDFRAYMKEKRVSCMTPSIILRVLSLAHKLEINDSGAQAKLCKDVVSQSTLKFRGITNRLPQKHTGTDGLEYKSNIEPWLLVYCDAPAPTDAYMKYRLEEDADAKPWHNAVGAAGGDNDRD